MLDARLDVRILGPLVVRVSGVAVPMGGPKQRGVLAMLLLSANRVVSRDRLIVELLADQSIGSADHALRNHVSRLRKVLAPAAVEQPRLLARAPGYLLRVDSGELDYEQFELLVSDGRELLAAGAPEAASAAFRAAEALWTGRALADLETEPFARVEVERLEELRLAAVEDRIEADMLAGRQRALVPELEALAAEHPFRERFHAQLMLALYRCGRQAEGLEVYRDARRQMRDELGLDPGVELQQLERAILTQDPALQLAPPESGRAGQRPVPPVCPYKGWAQYDAADAQLFFGRERLVRELLARFADVPLLAIVGASGSGKSSLLRAGLLPALGCESRILRPSEQPASGLAELIAGVHPGERLVVAVDQFEELLAASVAEPERRAFIASLTDACWDPERRVRIVLALRADFFADLARYGELAELVGANHVLLGPMSGGDLRRAIVGPAERAGLAVEPALVDTLVSEVSGERGGLPLLSTTLVDLWHERDGDSLALSAYQRTGGLNGAIGRHAEAAFGALTDEERTAARRVLLHLVAGGDGEAVIRRRVAPEALNPDHDPTVARVVARLIDSRLLVAGAGTVELVHETLIEHWARLAEWLAEDADGERLHRRLAQAAGEWQAGGRDTSELYHGARLAATLEWVAATGTGTALAAVEQEFLAEGRKAATRASRRLRIVLASVVGLLILAVMAAAIAWQQRGDARRQATAAEAQRLGAQALIDPSLDQSLLLAREAVRLDDSAVTRGDLLAALLRSPAAIGVMHAGSNRLLDEALSPDGRMLAVRGDDGEIALFDPRRLRRIGSLAGSNQIGLFGDVRGPLRALAFSPDGRTLAVGGTDGNAATLEMVDTRTRRATPLALAGGGDIVTDVAYAPDGSTFAIAASESGTIHPPPELIETLSSRTDGVTAERASIAGARMAGYTPDGRFLVVPTGASSTQLLEARTLRTVRTFPVGGAAAVSPSLDEAAFGHADGSVTLLDLVSGRRRTLSGRAPAAIQAVAYSPNGGTLAAAAGVTIVVWDVRSGALRQTLVGHSAAVESLAFSPDGRTLYSAADDGSAIAWDLSGTRGLAQTFLYSRPRAAPSTGSAVSPDGSVFAVSPGPDRVSLRHTTTPTRPALMLRGPVGDVSGIAFAPNGSLVIATGSRNTVVWDTRTGAVVRVLGAAYGGNALAVSPNGRSLAIGGADGSSHLYSMRTWKLIGILGAGPSTSAIAFSPNGRLIVTADLAGVATIWNAATLAPMINLSGKAAAAFAVGFSPDGKLVAVGDSSGAVVLWSVTTGRLAGSPLIGHGGPVYSVSFDQRGRLVSFSGDGRGRLWDIATGTLLGSLPSIGGSSGSAVFFPGGSRLLELSSTASGAIWNVDPIAWQARACAVANRNLTRQEWGAFLGSRSFRAVCP